MTKRSFMDHESITDLINGGVLYSDSMEVAVTYYEGKLLELEKQINDFNIQEHPAEITRLAKDIVAIRTTIQNLGKG